MTQEGIAGGAERPKSERPPPNSAAAIRGLKGARVNVGLEVLLVSGDKAKWQAAGRIMCGVILAPPTVREGRDEDSVNVMFGEAVGTGDYKTRHPHFLSDAPFPLEVDGQEMTARLTFRVVRPPNPEEAVG